ncbi:MAG: hypothetical protein AAB919_03045 [Patescibacteria group bacterium]
MNTFTNSTVRTLGLAFAALVLLALPFVFAPKAHAADLFDGGDYYSYDTFVPDYPSDNGYSYDTFVPDGSSDDNGYSYDTFVPDGSYSDYGSSGYGYGGSSYLPSSFYSAFPSYRPQSYQPAGNVNQNQLTNINQNTCTAGSCNTAINAPTTINNSTNNGGSYPVYQPVYVPQQQPVYYPQQSVYQQPIAYNNRPAPYVSLAAVPYTGLDLGPWGTVAYWGFLILWCLGAAYLIVVKRVQNKLVSGLNAFLFGSAARKAATTATVHAAHAPVVRHSAPVAPQFSGIDPFIASQISRPAF